MNTSQTSFSISGQILDIIQKKFYSGTLHINNGKITKIEPKAHIGDKQLILCGFVDAHVHIESSMLVPTEFARMAVVHGTVATISDPHEIANVMGLEGVEYMLKDAEKTPFKFYFGAPSCVPATKFETAGAELNVQDIDYLMQKPEIKYLAEMMNFPGVLFRDAEVMQKIAVAQKYNKPVDGHAPGLRGEQAKQYIDAGISTDHECFTAEEAQDKLSFGMKILIREGSAAKNFEALSPLIPKHYNNMMFCSDDKHPDSLLDGHINTLIKRSLAKGFNIFDLLQMATLNPVQHYNMEVGLLREGDDADFIVVDNLEDFNVLKTYINGQLVAENGKTLLTYQEAPVINQFKAQAKQPQDFLIKTEGKQIRVIEALEGQLITNCLTLDAKFENGHAITDISRDILKICVVNRYQDAKPALGFIRNFGLKEGAIASSVGHDSHNIIAVGTDDESLCKAVNLLIASKGGISAVSKTTEKVLPLPVAGIMTHVNGYEVAQQYIEIDAMAKAMGATIGAPFMALSFMALLVIPQLKLSDLGLFDGEKFEFTDVFVK